MLKTIALAMLFGSSAYSASVEDRVAKLEKIVALQHAKISASAYFHEAQTVSQNFSASYTVRKVRMTKPGKFRISFNTTFQATNNTSVRSFNARVYKNSDYSTALSVGQTSLAPVSTTYANYAHTSTDTIAELNVGDELEFKVESTQPSVQLFHYSISVVMLPSDGQGTVAQVITEGA